MYFGKKSANDRTFGELNSTELRKLIFKMSQKMKDDNNYWKEIWPSTKIPKQKLGKCFRVSLKSWSTPKQTSCTQSTNTCHWWNGLEVHIPDEKRKSNWPLWCSIRYVTSLVTTHFSIPKLANNIVSENSWGLEPAPYNQ